MRTAQNMFRFAVRLRIIEFVFPTLLKLSKTLCICICICICMCIYNIEHSIYIYMIIYVHSVHII